MLHVKIPIVDQFNDQTIPRLHLTSETLTWDPLTTTYADQEAAMMDFTGAVETCTRVRDKFPLSCACRRHVADMSPTADNVGKIRPTGPVGDIDIFFFFVFPRKKMSGNADIS